MVMKKVSNLSGNDLNVKKSKGCYLVLWFFIIVLLGMFLFLFIKVKYFLNPSQTW